MNYLTGQLKDSKIFKITTAFFVILVAWWLSMYFRQITDSVENNYFTVIYSFIALIGGVTGWIYSKKWGGFKSSLGTAIAFLSFGLLTQFFGQVLYNYYILVLGTEVPYPSLGDVSYFASVIFYIIGTYKLAKVSGIKLSFSTVKGKILAFVIPLLILILSYMLLLRGYEADLSSLNSLIIVFLDFGFPIGQVIYVSVAILALMISKEILGGMMRKPIMLLIYALIFQYIADFTFSYMFSMYPEKMYTGDILDLLYCTSYFIMAISLFSIGDMFYKVQES